MRERRGEVEAKVEAEVDLFALLHLCGRLVMQSSHVIPHTAPTNIAT